MILLETSQLIESNFCERSNVSAMHDPVVACPGVAVGASEVMPIHLQALLIL